MRKKLQRRYEETVYSKDKNKTRTMDALVTLIALVVYAKPEMNGKVGDP